MKKLLFILMSVALLFSVSSCGGSDEDEESDLLFMTIVGDSLDARRVEMCESLVKTEGSASSLRSQVTIANSVYKLDLSFPGSGAGEFQVAEAQVLVTHCIDKGTVGGKPVVEFEEVLYKSFGNRCKVKWISDAVGVNNVHLYIELETKDENGAVLVFKGDVVAAK